MSENVDRLVVKISQTLDTSGERSQRTISVMDIWIELQMGRHLPTEKTARKVGQTVHVIMGHEINNHPGEIKTG